MRYDNFGEEDLSNPNYKAQITGFADNGKAGYLRVSYGYSNYEEAVSPFFWDWDKDFEFTNEAIEEFERIVKKMKEKKEWKQEYLDFAEFGKKLNKEGKHPKVHISY